MLGFLTKKNNDRGDWLKVSELQLGMEIAVPRGEVFSDHLGRSENLSCANDEVLTEGEGDVLWDEIVSIEQVGEEQVYDIEVEGTHNFVAGHLMNENGEHLEREEEKRVIDKSSTISDKKLSFGALYAHNTYVTGNIGVGTSTPYARLSVAGGDTSTTLIASDALTGFTGNLLDLKVASSSVFTVNQSGNLTAANATSTNFAITSLGGGGGDLKVAADGSIYEGSDATGAGGGFAWDVETWGVSTTTTLGFLNGFLSTASSTIVGNATTTGDFSAGNVLFVKEGGSVGVGITSPANKLHVGGIIEAETGDFYSNTEKLRFAASGFPTSYYHSISTTHSNAANGNNKMTFNVSNAASGAVSVMTLTGAGDVGIGTTTPWGQLSVNPNGISGPSFVVGSSTRTDFIVTKSGSVGVGMTGTTTSLFAIQGKAATYQDLLQVSSSTGAKVFDISWYGGLTQNIASTTAVDIQDGSGVSVFAIDTTQSTTASGIDITAGGSQTGNLLNFFSSGGSFLSGFTASGALLFDVSSTTAIQVLNGSASQVFAVDTVNNWLQIATSTSPTFTTDGQFAIGNADATSSGGRIWIRSGATTFRFQSDANTADYSEFFFQYEDSEVGDVISLANKEYIDDMKRASTTTAPEYTGTIHKAGEAYDNKILGVVTERGTSFNNPEDTRQNSKNFANVGLLGHVVTKVTNENGPIEAGDFLTSSEQNPGFAMKATRSGYILGQAVEDFVGESINDTGVITVFVNPEYRIIENTFVLGDGDGQLVNNIANPLHINATSSVAMFFGNQNGSGNLLQLQQRGIDRLIVRNDGSIKIFSSIASTANNSIFSLENIEGEVFSINSNGDTNVYGNLKIVGNIYANKDTAGSAVIAMGGNSTKVTFEKSYAGVPKIVVTVLGLPEGPYGVVDKTQNGFTILMNGVAQKDIKFDWIAIYQPEEVNSVSGLMSIIPGNYDDGFGEIIIVSDTNNPSSSNSSGSTASTTPSTGTSTPPIIDDGQVAGASTSTPPIIDDTDTTTSTTTPPIVEEPLVEEPPVEEPVSEPIVEEPVSEQDTTIEEVI